MHHNLPSNGPLSRLNGPPPPSSLFIRNDSRIVIALYLYKFRIGPISTRFDTEIHREIKIRRDTKPRGTKFSIFWGELEYGDIQYLLDTRARARVCVCIYIARARVPPPLPFPPDPRNEIDSATGTGHFQLCYVLYFIARRSITTIGWRFIFGQVGKQKCF